MDEFISNDLVVYIIGLLLFTFTFVFSFFGIKDMIQDRKDMWELKKKYADLHQEDGKLLGKEYWRVY